MDWFISKSTLGLAVLIVAILNLYWAARIHSLMSATGTPEYVQACKAQAGKLNRYSKLSYSVVVAVVALYLYLQTGK